MERKNAEITQELAIFCPSDRVDEVMSFVDQRFFPFGLDARKTTMAGEDGPIEGVNIHLTGNPEAIKALFRKHMKWEPPIYQLDGEHFDA